MGKLDVHMQKDGIGSLFYTIHKINSKWIKDLNIRPKTIILLEENIGEKFYNICLGNDFLDVIAKAQAKKCKNRPSGMMSN